MRRSSIHLLLLSVVAQWGLAFVAIKELVTDVSPLTVTTFRFAFTSAIFLPMMLAWRPARPRFERRDLPRLFLLAVTGVSAYHLSLNFGERFVSAGVASLVVGSMPVIVAVLAVVYLKEQMSAAKAAGIALAFVGVALLTLKGTPGAGFGVRNVGGALLVFVAPLSWAVYTTVAKPLVPKYGAIGLTAASMVLGTALFLPFGLPTAIGDIGRLTARDWGWLAFLGVGCTAYAYVVWNVALRALPASTTAAWVYLVPLLSLTWAAILLGERLTLFVAVGGALVLAGVILTERVTQRAARGSRARETAPVGSS